MSYENRFWDRDSLYEEVWATPMAKLAQKYGISDVGLAKVCRKLAIPLPGRGYWAKKDAGQAVEKMPLPSFKEPYRLMMPKPKPEAPGSRPSRHQMSERRLPRSKSATHS
jgi:hypothetical protein